MTPKENAIVRLLEDNLDYLSGSPEFDERCRKAAEVAWTIRQLRPAALAQFKDVPFLEYVKRLSKKTGVAIEPVLEWFGVKSLDRPAEVPGAVRLASRLGLDQRRCRILLKVGFADLQGEPAFPQPMLNPDAVGRDDLNACEAVLASLQWSDESLQLIQALERGVAIEYGR
jgi:hypothetical protein